MNIDPVADLELTPVSFSDVDMFSDWEIRLGWDIASTQLSAGANEIDFDHFAFPELLIGHFRSKRCMQNVFAVPEGTVVLLISRAKLPFVWNGLNVSPDLMGVVRAGRENWAKVPAGLDCYEFMVSENLIRQTEMLPPSFFAETNQFERSFVPLIQPIAGQFVRGLDEFFLQGRRSSCSNGARVNGKQFFSFVVEGLQRVAETGLLARDWQEPKPGRRLDLVKKGREFVHANLTEQISADDIAHALGVSYRVLNYAFKDTLGISPYQYVLTEKLHAVRRQLKSGRGSVIETCFSYGFGTPSRFARQYFRHFNELPSDTMEQVSGRRSPVQ